MPLPDCLVAGEPLRKKVGERRCFEGTTLSRHYKGVRDLPAIRVRDADYAAVGNVGVLEQRRFELGGRDAERAAFDHLLLTVDDECIAAFIDETDVSTMEPSVAQHTRGFVGCIPVALHQLRTPDADLSDLAGSQHLLAGIQVYDTLFGVGHDDADALQP